MANSYISLWTAVSQDIDLFAGSDTETGDTDGAVLSVARFNNLRDIASLSSGSQRIAPLPNGNRWYVLDDGKLKIIAECSLIFPSPPVVVDPPITPTGTFRVLAWSDPIQEFYDETDFVLRVNNTTFLVAGETGDGDYPNNPVSLGLFKYVSPGAGGVQQLDMKVDVLSAASESDGFHTIVAAPNATRFAVYGEENVTGPDRKMYWRVFDVVDDHIVWVTTEQIYNPFPTSTFDSEQHGGALVWLDNETLVFIQEISGFNGTYERIFYSILYDVADNGTVTILGEDQQSLGVIDGVSDATTVSVIDSNTVAIRHVYARTIGSPHWYGVSGTWTRTGGLDLAVTTDTPANARQIWYASTSVFYGNRNNMNGSSGGDGYLVFGDGGNVNREFHFIDPGGVETVVPLADDIGIRGNFPRNGHAIFFNAGFNATGILVYDKTGQISTQTLDASATPSGAEGNELYFYFGSDALDDQHIAFGGYLFDDDSTPRLWVVGT